jgi:hypothetical protein
MCIDGGASLHSSHCQLKQWALEVNAGEPAADSWRPLKWSRTPIIFDEEDHPDRTTVIGCLPLLVSRTICNLKVNKMLVDDGARLNPISPKVISKLQISEEELEATGTFQGINLVRRHPKGKITLPVTFGGKLNYQTEKVVFDVVELPLPYNGILGCPALAKFMAASHYAYNTLKMPGPMGIISIPSNKKDAIICVDRMYRDAVAAEAAEVAAPAKDAKKKKEASRDAGKDSGKRASSKCAAPVEDLPESSTSKKPKVASPAVKKVPARQDGADDTFTICSTLDDK